MVDMTARPDYKPPLPTPCGLGNAQVAQLVEHATENRSVGGSIPPLGTNPYSSANPEQPRSGLPIVGSITMPCDGGRCRRLAGDIAGMPDVLECHRLTGDARVLLKVAVSSPRAPGAV